MDHQTITAERGRRAADLRAAAIAALEQDPLAAGVLLDLDDDTCVAAGPKAAILMLLNGAAPAVPVIDAPRETIHCREFHELAMDYRAAPTIGAHVAYSAMLSYIDARIKRSNTPISPAVQVIDAPRVETAREWRNTLEQAANKLVTYSQLLASSGNALQLVTELRAISEALPAIARQAQPTDRDAWISVDERLPEIPSDVPKYSCHVNVLVSNDGSVPRPMRYARNMYAKTEKGRAPRWEEWDGRLAFNQPTHWMSLPAAPALKSEQKG